MKSEFNSRLIFNPISRRHFLKISATTAIALPILECLQPRNAKAQSSNNAQTIPPAIMAIPVVTSMKILDWCGAKYNQNLSFKNEALGLQWDNLSNMGSVSNLLNDVNLPGYSQILREYLSVVMGISSSCRSRGHDFTLGHTLLGDPLAVEFPSKKNIDYGTFDVHLKKCYEQKYGKKFDIFNFMYGLGSFGPWAPNSSFTSSRPVGGALARANGDLRSIASMINLPINGGGGGNNPTPTPTPSPTNGGGSGSGSFNRGAFLMKLSSNLFSPFSNYLRNISPSDANKIDLMANAFNNVGKNLNIKTLSFPVNNMSINSLSIPPISQLLGDNIGITNLVNKEDKIQWMNIFSELIALLMYTRGGFYNISGFNHFFGDSLQLIGNIHDGSHDVSSLENLSEGRERLLNLTFIFKYFITPLMDKLRQYDSMDPGFLKRVSIGISCEHATGGTHSAGPRPNEPQFISAGKATYILSGFAGDKYIQFGKRDSLGNATFAPDAMIRNHWAEDMCGLSKSEFANDDYRGNLTFGLVDAACGDYCYEFAGGQPQDNLWIPRLGGTIFNGIPKIS